MDKSNLLLNRTFEFISRLVYLNVLWLLGTLAGGIVFGLYPATFSVFYLTRQWLRDPDKALSLGQEFKQRYRFYFKKANQYGLLLTALLIISIIDLVFAYQNFFLSDTVTVFGVVFTMVALLFTYVTVALWIYVPLTVVYFPNFTFRESFKFSFISILGTPLLTVQLWIILLLSLVTFSILISVTLFIGFSLPIYVWMRVAHQKYRSFFIVKQSEHDVLMNIKYLPDKFALLRFLKDEEPEYEGIKESDFANQTYLHPDYDDVLSSVAFNRVDDGISGFVLVRSHEKTVTVQSLFTSRHRLLENLTGLFLEVLKTQALSLGFETLEFLRQDFFTGQPLHMQETYLLSQGFKIKNNRTLIYNFATEAV